MLADGQDSSEEGKGYEAGGQRYSDDTVREPCNVMICDLMLYQIEDVFWCNTIAFHVMGFDIISFNIPQYRIRLNSDY
jgi:hypothetical protein